MQRRLLVSMLAVAVTAVLLLGVPLSFLVVRQRTNEANQQVHRDATTLATELQERYDAGLPPDPLQMGRSLSDRYVIIVQRGGVRTADDSGLAQRDSDPHCSSNAGNDRGDLCYVSQAESGSRDGVR